MAQGKKEGGHSCIQYGIEYTILPPFLKEGWGGLKMLNGLVLAYTAVFLMR